MLMNAHIGWFKVRLYLGVTQSLPHFLNQFITCDWSWLYETATTIIWAEVLPSVNAAPTKHKEKFKSDWERG